MRYKSDIPWLDHTFQAEDTLRSAGRSALRLSEAFAETGNAAVADKVESIAAAIDAALMHLREAAKARNLEVSAHMGHSIGSILNTIMTLPDKPAVVP